MAVDPQDRQRLWQEAIARILGAPSRPAPPTENSAPPAASTPTAEELAQKASRLASLQDEAAKLRMERVQREIATLEAELKEAGRG